MFFSSQSFHTFLYLQEAHVNVVVDNSAVEKDESTAVSHLDSTHIESTEDIPADVVVLSEDTKTPSHTKIAAGELLADVVEVPAEV